MLYLYLVCKMNKKNKIGYIYYFSMFKIKFILYFNICYFKKIYEISFIFNNI